MLLAVMECMLSSSELEGSGSRSRNISPVTSGGRESSVTKPGVIWLAVTPLAEGIILSAVCVSISILHVRTHNMRLHVCIHICLQSPRNQSFHRQISRYTMNVDDHRVA